MLEVKGGLVTLEDGRWRQNGQPMKSPPRDQAMRLARALHSEIEKRGAEPPPFDGACAFPDHDFSEDWTLLT